MVAGPADAVRRDDVLRLLEGEPAVTAGRAVAAAHDLAAVLSAAAKHLGHRLTALGAGAANTLPPSIFPSVLLRHVLPLL